MDKFSIENIYYLGPEGSNVNRAMLKFISLLNIQSKNIIPLKNIKAVMESHRNDADSVCILPIENSIEGIVRETIDNLLRINDKNIKIQAEISLPINHFLLSTGKDKSKIKKIISHPQALAQCSNYLYENFPQAELKEFSSTSYAAEKVMTEKDETLAAISTDICAEIFNLNILDKNINDEKDNKTRFYLLGRTELGKKNNPKTAIILSVKNKAGALCDVLKIFSQNNINLTYIDSRPSKKRLGEYLFFMELEGNIQNKVISDSLNNLSKYVDFVRVLGCFEVFE